MEERELDQTPTWAVALVSAVIITISILLETILHGIRETLERKQKKALVEALEKIKGELMILGFISLILSFGQRYISKICIPVKLANTMLPCYTMKDERHGEGEHHRMRLLNERRVLSDGSPGEECASGHEPLISFNGLHQLHIFMFFLAVLHVINGAMTMMLGRLKIRGWKEWEREIARDYDDSNDPSRIRFTKDISFVRENTYFMSQSPFLFYFACFFRQFFRSVHKADYFALRHGFVSVHLAPGSTFNFQKYIKRSLEDDFKVVVGIDSVLWVSAVLYLLLNVNGGHVMFWLSLVPLFMMLAVGTKLQAIIAQMAFQIEERHSVIQGIPLVQVSDKYFWFGKPKLVLQFIHLALFQSAFEITYFLWISYEFGISSCFHHHFSLSIIRVCVGFVVQFMCSYITLPLYALVAQMGSTMKRSVFDEQTSKALMNWHMQAKKNARGGMPKTRTAGGSPVRLGNA